MANQVYADSIGLRIEDIIGKTDRELGVCADVIPGRDTFENFCTQDQEVLSDLSGFSVRQIENAIRGGDYSSRDARTIRTPLVDVNGEVTAFLIQSRDLRDMRILENSLMESVKVRENELTLLNDFMVKMMSSQDLEVLLQNIADMMIEYTAAENAIMFLVGETREFLQAIVHSGPQKKPNIGDRRAPGTGPAALAWATGKTQYVDCTSQYPSLVKFWPERTQLIIEPFIVNGKVIGVAAIGAPQSAESFKDSTRLVNSFANLAGIAISDARAREFTELELLRTRALNKLSDSISEFTNNPDQFCTEQFMLKVSEATMSAMDISRANGHLLTAEGEKIISQWILTDKGIEKISDSEEIKDTGTIESWCIQNNQFAHLQRNVDDPRLSSDIHLKRRELDIGCSLCMPITSREKVLGAMVVHRSSEKRDFGENDINIFKSIVNQVSAALCNRELSNALQFAAYHDSLTQLPNRRLFEKELSNDIVRCKRERTQGALMFLDLDGFKAVNDSFGHRLGDQLLTHVADRLRSCLPASNLLARIGGDEFAVIVPEATNKEQVLDLASQLCDSLDSAFEIDGTVHKIGVSIGVSYYPDDGVSAEIILHNADEAMYKAKADGKGRIVCFNHLAADGINDPVWHDPVLKRVVDGN